ncbi:uncharacterized protein LOC132747803 [Ruditapes philippinarum]|uniref:uncharacterized protein LOC132747803 n=1 Tax=Ruditapes philippinarum TaxID=129788 RepID=UPI00295B146B|nr:uncharacterized protein LOC132747803 [Ruditapes philippinarum]
MKMLCYLAILVISSTFSYVCGCTCAPFDPEIDYCARTSGFAAVFKIKGNGTVGGFKLAYDVDILYKYVFEAPGETVNIDQLFTAISGSMCGIRLRPDSFYIITGYFEVRPDQPTKMVTALCYTQDYFKESPVVNGDPPPCERSDKHVEFSE